MVLAGGFSFTEGPVWMPADGALVFSDIPEARTHRWSPARGVEVLREDTGWGNGNALDLDGGLLTCEHHGRRVSRRGTDGAVSTLVDGYLGKRLNSPNDIVVKSDGTVWFTWE